MIEIKKYTRLLLFTLLTCIPFTSQLLAQSKFYRGAIGMQGGIMQYNGELGNDFFRLKTVNPFSGLSYSHYASTLCDVRAGVAFGSWGYTHPTFNSFDVDVINVNLDVKFKLVSMDNPFCMPYFFGGIGFHHYDNWVLLNAQQQEVEITTIGNVAAKRDMEGFQSVPSIGAGLQFRFAERVFVSVEERFSFPGVDAADGVISDFPDRMLMHTVGIHFGLFPWNDSDGDRVDDKHDKCPNTPSIAIVDEFGCPIDTDLDDIPDFEDNCIDKPGDATGKGCPDRDHDYTLDIDDRCPDVFGLIERSGCPDTDEDGLIDIEDDCPEVSGNIQLNGCPDMDGDGVADKNDECAATPLKIAVDKNGCPLDKDGDDVADYLDKCPDDAGIKNLDGCPEVKEEVRELFRQALTGIKFETGKEVIRKESFAILDSVAIVLQNNPLYKLRISGYTDNQGDSLKNIDLSDRRAKSVQQYLIDHGIPTARILSATGYGSDRPVADNSTKEGRALNRRVEFEVEF